ncbi:hypothetical protein GWI33_012006 [Rhynchophorus ferrugineus]|uniref:Uncharacterized protein n=1 Tax=Rhynchophorus ferrugineus TaxID=354439 RepID=A0A834IRZ2_RHYFE|nr:hypothetical protein GWI33_012006 [Rhynchophorus ferrugineus]
MCGLEGSSASNNISYGLDEKRLYTVKRALASAAAASAKGSKGGANRAVGGAKGRVRDRRPLLLVTEDLWTGRTPPEAINQIMEKKNA